MTLTDKNILCDSVCLAQLTHSSVVTTQRQVCWEGREGRIKGVRRCIGLFGATWKSSSHLYVALVLMRTVFGPKSLVYGTSGLVVDSNK